MNLSKRTAERMLKNIEMQLQGLAQEQQAMNGNVGGGKMRQGGKVNPNYTGMGIGFMNTPHINRNNPVVQDIRAQWGKGRKYLDYQIPRDEFQYEFNRPMTPEDSMVIDKGNWVNRIGNNQNPGMNFIWGGDRSQQRYDAAKDVRYPVPGDHTYYGEDVMLRLDSNSPYNKYHDEYFIKAAKQGTNPMFDKNGNLIKDVAKKTGYSKGGRVKMPWGGDVPYGYQMNSMGPYQTNFGIPEIKMPKLSSPYATAPVAVTDQNLSKIPGYGLNNPIPGLAPTIKPGGLRSMPNYEAGAGYQPKGGGFDWNSAMGLLPGAFNALAGAFSGKPDMLNPQEFQNPYEDQSFAMMPDQFRVDDMLGDNRNAYATYLKNVNSTGNSRGERMANYGSGMNRMNEANTRAWALKNNQENAMRTNKAQMRNEQGVRRAGVNLQVRDMNDQNQAAARNNRMDYLGAAASAFGNYGTVNRQMANQEASQMAYIDALKGSGLNQFDWLKLNKYGSPNATNTNSARNRTGLSKPTMEDLMRLGILPKYATQTNRVKGI